MGGEVEVSKKCQVSLMVDFFEKKTEGYEKFETNLNGELVQKGHMTFHCD